MTSASFAPRLLRWYARHGRDLPWRTRPDPYLVWVSEIMLQQTRVETVVPYFDRWMRRFPDVRALASASETDVLSAWEGLGYYARVRNMRRAAKLVVSKFAGSLPADPDLLQSLPGVGRYTAGAIASIAFGFDTAALDGNIRRVLARLFDVKVAADAPAGRARLWRLAEMHLPKGRAGDYNQALMDLGATICLPRKPHCPDCPVRAVCAARRVGTVDRRPVLHTRKPLPSYFVGAAVITRRGRVLLARRPSAGLLGGMWEFPNARVPRAVKAGRSLGRPFVTALERAYGVRVHPNGPFCGVRHAYTHYRVEVDAHKCDLVSSRPNPRLRWVGMAELAHFPMGKVDRQISLRLAGEAGAWIES